MTETEFNKGVVLLGNKEFAKALKHFKKLRPCKEVLVNIGIAYRELGKFDSALRSFYKAADVKSWNGFTNQCPRVLANAASIVYDNQDNDNQAQDYFMAAHVLDPSDDMSLWNFGVTGLRRYFDGEDMQLDKLWDFYSKRFSDQTHIKVAAYNQDMLHWDYKTAYPDESIAVLGDQGHGDMLMFARYIPLLKKYFSKVYVQPRQGMHSLFENIYTPECPAKYFIPVCSLGKLVDGIPEGEWLADRYVAKEGGEFAVGCAWSGSPFYGLDRYRSCPAEYFDTLDVKKYTFAPNESRAGYEHLLGNSWEDTIRNLSKVDLVVAVDTSIVHLCGSLGKPCWVLMPTHFSDFRWGSRKSGEKNVWYKSVRVIRNPGSWDAVFKQIRNEIGSDVLRHGDYRLQ